MSAVRILGPQRNTEGARASVDELLPHGPIATINAGWREREDETGELDHVLGGRMLNLELYRRWRKMRNADSAFDQAEIDLRRQLGELQTVYQIRLKPALETIEALRRRDAVVAVGHSALEDAFAVVAGIDAWHEQGVAEARAEFYRRTDLGNRPEVVRHRQAVASMINDSAGFVITGGHVGVLLHCLHVFNLRRMMHRPVITWSAGAMALAERVVLFHDRAPQGALPAQVYAEGLGMHTGMIVFPHADHRLLLDQTRSAQLAQRFAPARCVLLDPGVVIDTASELPESVRVFDADHGVSRAPQGSDHG